MLLQFTLEIHHGHGCWLYINLLFVQITSNRWLFCLLYMRCLCACDCFLLIFWRCRRMDAGSFHQCLSLDTFSDPNWSKRFYYKTFILLTQRIWHQSWGQLRQILAHCLRIGSERMIDKVHIVPHSELRPSPPSHLPWMLSLTLCTFYSLRDWSMPTSKIDRVFHSYHCVYA